MSLAAASIPVLANGELVAKNGGEAIVTPGTVLPRASQSVGGGSWDYGVVGGYLYSGYYHGSLYHSSTAKSYYGTDKDYAYAGDSSFAEVKASGHKGTDKVYWDTY